MSKLQSKYRSPKCFCCRSGELESICLGNDLIDPSNFYQEGQKPPRFCYQLSSCQDCGHVEVKSNNPCWLSTRKYDFITYNEPTEYFSLVANLIRSLDIDLSDTSLHTFSYKDFKLADYLREEFKIVDIQKNDHAKTSDFWLPTPTEEGDQIQPAALEDFINEIETSTKVNKIVLISRFFDHADSIELINAVLDLCAKSVHLLFDINDYEKLFRCDTLDYVWIERRNLFARDKIDQLAKARGVRSHMLSYESETTSPTILGLLSNQIGEKLQDNSHDYFKTLQPDVISKLKNLRKLWTKAVPHDSRFGIIGASHKGISLAQFVLGEGVLYSLHDDKEVLMGKTPPVDPPHGFHSVSDFDFSSYSHIAITTTKSIASKIITKLRSCGFDGIILDFDCRILN